MISKKTRPVHRRIALVFDFDDTLAAPPSDRYGVLAELRWP